MKKMVLRVIFLISMLMTSTSFAGLNDYPNIAVLDFGNKANTSADLTFEDTGAVTDYIVECLLDSDRFEIIERDQLQAMMSEHHLNLSGMVNPATATKIGQYVGVQYLVYGNVVGMSTKVTNISYDNDVYGGVGNKQYSVTANVTLRIIDVTTGRIAVSAHGRGTSTSTSSEIKLDRRKEEYITDSSYNSETGETEEVEIEQTSGAMHTIKIGTENVSQIQVHNALYKAAEDVVYNKQWGLLAKIDGRGKRHKH